MVKRLRLNEKVVREAPPEQGRDYQIFDAEVRGFAVCIYRSGNRAFTLDYRSAGRQRRMTIGRWPEWSTKAARERAKELRREIDAGADPLAERGQVREAPRFRDLMERYIEEHLPNLAPTNASDQKSMLHKLVAGSAPAALPGEPGACQYADRPGRVDNHRPGPLAGEEQRLCAQCTRKLDRQCGGRWGQGDRHHHPEARAGPDRVCLG